MTPEEIVPGVYGMDLTAVNAFVLVDDDVTLIDTGLPRSAKQIEGALREIGRTKVDNIALTHHHPDHRGGAPTLGVGARTYVHPLDAGVVRGDREQPGPTVGGLRKLVFTALGPLMTVVIGRLEPAPQASEIEDGAEIPGTDGLIAVHTPGHTAGHLSYLHPGKRVLFVGDAAQNRTGLALSNPYFREDEALEKASLRRIAELDFDTAVFGHGKVLGGKANAEFRRLVDRLAT